MLISLQVLNALSPEFTLDFSSDVKKVIHFEEIKMFFHIFLIFL